jgi:hypothetical protein
MENQLTKISDNKPTFSQEDIDASQSIAGQSKSMSIPFVPIVTINNKKTKKMATIDGVEQEVEVPAKKGFLMLKKDEEGQMIEDFLSGDISGVILKERFMIEKKYVKDENQYRSDEFDGWDSHIQLYEKGKRGNIIFEGQYSDIRDNFTNTDDKGKKTKDYDLFVMLYVNLEASGTIVRIKLKMTSDNGWFDYKNSFENNEPWAGFMTHFNLIEKKVGDITYWHIMFERGEITNFKEQLNLQKELNKFFSFIAPIKKKNNNEIVYEVDVTQPKVKDTEFEFPEEGIQENEVNVDDIPF